MLAVGCWRVKVEVVPGQGRRHVKSGVLLLVAAVSLYVLLPTLLSVFSSWRSLSHLDWYFAILVLVCEAASYVCLWELDRIALGTSAWFPIACAQLAGNAVGRFVPGAPTPWLPIPAGGVAYVLFRRRYH